MLAEVVENVSYVFKDLRSALLHACKSLPNPWESSILMRAFFTDLQRAVEKVVRAMPAITYPTPCQPGPAQT